MRGSARRGRLFRKYVVVLFVLVGGVLMAASLVELYFSYRETQRAIVREERAKAVAAAGRIEQFLKEIEQQVRETTRTASDDPDASQVGPAKLGFREGLGAALADQRALDFVRVLRNVPAISELSYLDLSGKEQLRVSRLDLDVVGSGEDFSRAPKFVEAKSGKTYWSPVYLKNESEPYATLSIPVGKYAVEVTTAEVSLGPVQKMMGQIEVGPGGYAYVVDSRNQLITRPDGPSLRAGQDLSSLARVRSARAEDPAGSDDAQVTVAADGFRGGMILSAHASIGSLGWLVFVERPAGDAYAPLRAPIVRSVVIFVLGLLLSVLASLLLARRMAAPIRVLQEGAARIGAGTLDRPIELRTGDEIEGLASSFNQMAASLKESYEGLEQKVEARTSELAEANRDLTETLEQQTATSEILQVLSQSPTDAQPVFDAIARAAVRLCGASYSVVGRYDGRLIHLAAYEHVRPEGIEAIKALFPAHPSRDTTTARAVLDRAVVHVPDVLADPDYDRSVAVGLQNRSTLAVPMLLDGQPIGVVVVTGAEAGAFSERQIELLQTFADQAVIAVQNVRLFKELAARTAELSRSVDQLTALGEVGRAVSSTLDLETVLTTIVSRAVEISGLDGGVVFEYDEDGEVFVQRAQAGTGGSLAAARGATRVRKSEGVVGRTAVALEPVAESDITEPGAYIGPNRENLIESGVRAILAVPMVREGQLIGCLGVTRNQPGEFPAQTIELLRTFATQSALAIQNARLFREIEDKSRQLEAASRHKSEFLANMSHELRTPLNAIIGFSEVLSARMFGDLNDKQEEYLRDIHESGQPLLSLINDILDLSKIEAGRMELDPTLFDLPTAIDHALTFVRERAARRGIALHRAVDQRLGQIRGDERKIKQVLLNLLSNALKFTAEGGRIAVGADVADGMAEVSVSDTGIGIAPEHRDAVFEEFRQVGTAARKVEGTGLGLTLSRKFIELHGGRIWVESELGAGSTFRFTLIVGNCGAARISRVVADSSSAPATG